MPLLWSAALASTLAAIGANSSPDSSIDTLAGSFTAPAPDFAALATAAYTFAPQSPATPASAPDLDQAADAANRNLFFHRDSWRWQVTLAAATDFRDDHLALAGVAASCFLEDNLTIDFELNGVYFHSEEDDGGAGGGDDTGGLNLAMLFRWHFLMDETSQKDWSMYFDAGFGIAVTGSDVPSSGSDFNFTPQAGFGMSFRLGEILGMGGTDTFLLTGIRWHHVSNANIFESNPGTDRIMFYVGLNFPF